VLKSPLNLSAPTTQNAIDFSFPNHEGKPISLSDEKYQDKVKLIKIMGTWCPNCKDETKFILDYLEKNSSANYEVIAISFERYKEQAKSLEVITRFKDKMNIPYEVLYGGIYNKSEAAKKLPFMDSVISYPTLLFVDKNNKIRKIYTGFNGPATEEYEAFKAEFQATLNSLLAEI